jgi:hypothetical protein
MDMRNNTNPMKNDGSWAKVADKTYRHESGITIRYNHNAWLWMIDGDSFGWKTLGVAKYEAEKRARVAA